MQFVIAVPLHSGLLGSLSAFLCCLFLHLCCYAVDRSLSCSQSPQSVQIELLHVFCQRTSSHQRLQKE